MFFGEYKDTIKYLYTGEEETCKTWNFLNNSNGKNLISPKVYLFESSKLFNVIVASNENKVNCPPSTTLKRKKQVYLGKQVRGIKEESPKTEEEKKDNYES